MSNNNIIALVWTAAYVTVVLSLYTFTNYDKGKVSFLSHEVVSKGNLMAYILIKNQ